MNTFLFDIAIKGTLVLAGTAAVVLFLRRSSAAARHLAWSAGLAAAAVLPLLELLLPRWQVGILPAGTSGLDALAAASAGSGGDAAGTSLLSWAATTWLIGAAVVLGAILVGRIRVWRLARSSEELIRGPWAALATTLCGEMDLARPVDLRLSDRAVMPMMWGIVRPVILLPVDARKWSDGMRRDVLLHELAHVQRRDYVTQLVGRAACAIHWFNPLVWLAARGLRIERERACDDHVLRLGRSACDYAEHLLAVARTRTAVGGALALAAGSPFAERLTALLDDRRRRSVLSRRLTVPATLVAAGVVVPLASIDPDARPIPLAVRMLEEEPGPASSILPPPPSANAGTARQPLPGEIRIEAGEKAKARPEDPARRWEPRPSSTPPRRPASEGESVAGILVPVPKIEVVIDSGSDGEKFVLVADGPPGSYLPAAPIRAGKKAVESAGWESQADSEQCSEEEKKKKKEIENDRPVEPRPAIHAAASSRAAAEARAARSIQVASRASEAPLP